MELKTSLALTKLLNLGKVRFFLGGERPGALEGRVSSESEHQKGRAIILCQLFKGRITHLFQNFFNENFCDVAFHFSFHLL